MSYRFLFLHTGLVGALLLGMPSADALTRITQCAAGKSPFATDIERSQAVASTESYLSHDFAELWQDNGTQEYLGFVGNDWMRLRIHFDHIHKDAQRPNQYEAAGEVRYRDRTERFSGRIVVRQIRRYDTPDLGVDEEMKDRLVEQGIVLADYRFELEDADAGILLGTLASSWYLDKDNHLHADSYIPSDSYGNHFFHGQLIGQRQLGDEPTSWGQWRIPCSGDLDIGAGEFSVDPRYRANGWE